MFNPHEGRTFIADGSGNLLAFDGAGNIKVYDGGSGIFTLTGSGVGMGTGASGGNVLASSGPAVSVTLRSWSGNGPIMIGGVGQYAPTSGVGIELFNQETLTLRVTNTNQISVFNESGFSGQGLSIIVTA